MIYEQSLRNKKYFVTGMVFTAGRQHVASDHEHTRAAAAEGEQLQSGQPPTLALEAVCFNIVIKKYIIKILEKDITLYPQGTNLAKC